MLLHARQNSIHLQSSAPELQAACQGNELLQIRQLDVNLSQNQASIPLLTDINLTIEAGKTLALVGESGSGKSMTAKAIMQLLPSNITVSARSKVYFHQQNLFALPEAKLRDMRGQKIGMIFQEPMVSLNPVLTIGQQITEVLTTHQQLSKQDCRAKCIEWLTAVGIAEPERRQHEYPHQLSGGMKQRVMIAMMLASEPDLLIADEPTTALDVTIQAQILDLLVELQQKKGMAILLISHDLGVVKQMADSVAVMYAGEIVEYASAEQFFNQPCHPYSQHLFAALPDISNRGHLLASLPAAPAKPLTQNLVCRFVDRCPHAFNQCQQNAPALYSHDETLVRCFLYQDKNSQTLAKPEANSIAMHQHRVSQQTVLSLHDLRVHFPIKKGILQRTVASVKAVDGVSLKLTRGKTLALVGESGCGKTTIGRAILNLIEKSAGDIEFFGQPLSAMDEKQQHLLRQRLQIIFQDPFSSMDPRMMVADIIAEGIDAFALAKNKADREQLIAHLLQQVGLPEDSQYRYPHEFSGGQRQRICIARALALAPEIIVCDEPTSALDVSVQAQIINLLKQLQQEKQLTYLFISHDLSVVAHLADEIAVMYLGRIVEQGPAKEVLTAAKHPYTQALMAAVPSIHSGRKQKNEVKGEQPSPINPPSGCYFHPRCPKAMPQCKTDYPAQFKIKDKHTAACFLWAS